MIADHRRNRRSSGRWVGALATVALLTASACGSDDDDAGTSESTTPPSESTTPPAGDTEDATPETAVSTPEDSEDQELFEMEITVSSYPASTGSIPFIVGMELGFFEEEGIQITEVAGSGGGGTTVRNVLTAGLPFGEVSTVAAATAYLAGAPLVAVSGTLHSVSELNWVVPASNTSIQSIEDLPGHSVGFTNPGGATEAVLNLSLDRAGVDLAEVELVATGGLGPGLTALDAGGVDVAANLEPIYSGDPDPYRVLWWGNDYVEEYQQLVLVTSPKMIEENPDIVEGFVRARARAVDWIYDNPGEAAQYWSDAADVEPDVALATVERILAANHYGVGFTASGLLAVEDAMKLIGVIGEDEIVPWPEIVDQQFLPPDIEQITVPTSDQ